MDSSGVVLPCRPLLRSLNVIGVNLEDGGFFEAEVVAFGH